MKKYRNEWKYICTNCDIELLKSRISNLLSIDNNSNAKGEYYIHSLYFDNYKNRCVKENDSGDFKRFKWRIRYYNDVSDGLFLEKKEKLFGRCYKEKCKLSKEQYNSIIAGDYMTVFWNTQEKVLQQFIIDIINKNFRPSVIIDYERMAFVEPITNIRITLDTNISAGYEVEKFLDGNYMAFPIQQKNYQILEVKFDYILPSYIKNIVCSFGFNQTAFSKYYLGRKRIDGVLL